jgi:tetratricopeptide (TPR) repeat protein
LAILSPTFVVPIVTEVAAERRIYLPLAALAALAVVGGYSLALWAMPAGAGGRAIELRRGWRFGCFAAPVAALALVLSLVSVRRLAAYHDEMTLWKDTVATQPNDPTALYNMCILLAREGRMQEAINDYRKALEIKPNYAEARYNLGNALLKVGKMQEALDEYQRAVEIDPDLLEAQSNLGIILLTMHRPFDATKHFKQALRIDPNDAEVCANLVVAYSQTNRKMEAVAAAERALQLARSQGQTELTERVEAWLTDNRVKPSTDSNGAAAGGDGKSD